MLQNSHSIDKILSRFPKERLMFSPEMAEIHLETLKANRERKTILSRLSALLEVWMHQKVARRDTKSKGPILEIGAGTLNHVIFESPEIDYDAIEPIEFLYENKAELTRIRNLKSDIRGGLARISDTMSRYHLQDAMERIDLILEPTK